MKQFFKQFKFFWFLVFIASILTFYQPSIGTKVADTITFSLKEMLIALPPIFILLGLMDVWVPKQTMMKYMGDGSGIKGIILSIILGSFSAGPLYGAFPVAAVFMKKGVKFTNVLIFLGAWSTTKVPMLLFEISALGYQFALLRYIIDIPGIIIIAFIIRSFFSKDEIKEIYQKAEELNP